MGTYPSYGGVEIVSTVLANQFIEDGHQVTIASYKQPLTSDYEGFGLVVAEAMSYGVVAQ